MHVLPLPPRGSQPAALPLCDAAALGLINVFLEPDSRRRVSHARCILSREPTVALWATACFIDQHDRWPTGVQCLAEWLTGDQLSLPLDNGIVGGCWPAIDPATHERWAKTAAVLAACAELAAAGHSTPESDDVQWAALLHRGWSDWKPWTDFTAEDHSPWRRQIDNWSDCVASLLRKHSAPDSTDQNANGIQPEDLSRSKFPEDWLRLADAVVAGLREFANGERSVDSSIQLRWLATTPGPSLTVVQLLHRLQESRRLEVAFQQAVERAKLDALKEFAYGASHELNNPLANIAMRAESLLAEETHPERRRKLATIHAQAFRAHQMISDLMLFARPPKLQLQPVILQTLLEQVMDGLRPVAQEQGTSLEFTDSEQEAIELNADPHYLAVAIEALCTNSLEALGAGGVVHVECRHHRTDHSASTASHVEILVRDNGPGISPDVRAHVFEPFFSGREAGRGLGLGLSKCWRIVTLHGGSIDIDSSPTGTTIRLVLPGARSNIQSQESDALTSSGAPVNNQAD